MHHPSSVLPFKSSMAIYARSASSPTSYIVTIFGCVSFPALSASLKKRSLTILMVSASTSSKCTVFIATSLFMVGSTPLYTTPIAPLPSSSIISYLPMVGFSMPSMMAVPSAVAFAPFHMPVVATAFSFVMRPAMSL